MKKVLLIDFGSTYTKITAVDIEKEKIIGTASSYTTVNTDINEGLSNAKLILENKYGKLEFDEIYACSSAAGGLRMMSCGLVSSVTSEAAKQASLGAGAKVLKVYSYELTEEDIKEIDEIKPEIFLLAGGTDGGNQRYIFHNAKMLSTCKSNFPIIIAGNRTVSKKCSKFLENKENYIVDNVMPKYGELNIEPAQNKIRDIFLKRIINAKGITKTNSIISGILMPTPSAMMKAMELLANGYEDEKGIGELLAIDIGGATTDIYSIADGYPDEVNIIYKGIKEPYIKRTVEGDIGMRYSIYGILEEVGIEKICKLSNLSISKCEEIINNLYNNPDTIPSNDKDLINMDNILASLAIEIATTRHAGKIEKAYTTSGIAYVQSGKNLTNINKVVVTGGSIVHLEKVNNIINHALYSEEKPNSLRPKKADILVDRKYILSAMGLLSEYYPKTAIRIMKEELKYNGN